MNPPTFQMTRGLILLLACACGAAVSNIVYIQPLLEQIRVSLNTSAGGVGLASTLTQVGYTLGLLLLVPLGDVLRRRQVIVTLMLVEAIFLMGTAMSQSLALLQIASLGIGIASVSAQLIVPLVAQLSHPEKRGQNVGTVMSGLLLGILLSRVVAGGIGGQFGWRAVFWMAAGLSLVLAFVLSRTLPNVAPTANLPFRNLMGSLWNLTKEEPQLRESALIGGLNFAAFLAFWTSLSFHLEGAPFHYSSQIVGLFGLVGAAGAVAAPLIGKRADVIGPRAIIGISTLMTAAAFGVSWAFSYNIVILILAVLFMDATVQGTHISNQTRIFALRSEARSRLNTVYMVSCFMGGSLGSLVSTLAWSHFGWAGVSATGLVFSLAAFSMHWAYGKRLKSSAEAEGAVLA